MKKAVVAKSVPLPTVTCSKCFIVQTQSRQATCTSCNKPLVPLQITTVTALSAAARASI